MTEITTLLCNELTSACACFSSISSSTTSRLLTSRLITSRLLTSRLPFISFITGASLVVLPLWCFPCGASGVIYVNNNGIRLTLRCLRCVYVLLYVLRCVYVLLYVVTFRLRFIQATPTHFSYAKMFAPLSTWYHRSLAFSGVEISYALVCFFVDAICVSSQSSSVYFSWSLDRNSWRSLMAYYLFVNGATFFFGTRLFPKWWR